jgi:two-component system, OmpR family, sensor histidine kinase KdpD
MVDYMRAHRIEGSWPASERVLVLVDYAQGANAVVRHAKRMADRLRAQWTAIHVETRADSRASEARSGRPRWRDFFKKSFTEKLIRAAGDASVHIVARAKDSQINHSARLKAGRQSQNAPSSRLIS